MNMAAAGAAKRRTGTAHRALDNSMDEADGGGVAAVKKRRKREREQMLQGFEYGPALTVSNANFELAVGSQAIGCVPFWVYRPFLRKRRM
jgi:hypothetical protein